MCNPRHTPFPVFAACTALPAVSDILSVTTRLCRFFATGTCSYDGTAASFPVPEGVFDATATSRTTENTGRRRTLQTQAIFNENTDRPDELARRFCTPDNCLVVVLRDNRFLFRLERAPGSHCRWHKGSSSRHQHLQDWLS